jgi:hypothetical protein
MRNAILMRNFSPDGNGILFLFLDEGRFWDKKRKRYSGQLEIAPKKYYFYANSNNFEFIIRVERIDSFLWLS